jgi:hypothetical protein
MYLGSKTTMAKFKSAVETVKMLNRTQQAMANVKNREALRI